MTNNRGGAFSGADVDTGLSPNFADWRDLMNFARFRNRFLLSRLDHYREEGSDPSDRTDD
jgi:hypothetical protein